MALYLQHLIEKTHSPGAVDSAFYDLKWAHDLAGIPSPTEVPPDSKDVIFKLISKGKGSCKLVAPDKPISYSTFRRPFGKDLQSLGVEPSKFGLHSLRSGGATMAANNGVNDWVFQRHGRYKPTDTYVDDNLEQRLKVSRFLGL